MKKIKVIFKCTGCGTPMKLTKVEPEHKHYRYMECGNYAMTFEYNKGA